MFAFKSWTKITARVSLIAVVLFNALAPTVTVAQAKQAPVSALGTNSQSPKSDSKEQENHLIPTFKRPEPRIVDNDADVSPLDTNNNSSADRVLKNKVNRPLMFIENVGQFDQRALFVARGSNTNIYISKKEIWFTVVERIKEEKSDKHSFQTHTDKLKKVKVVNLKMILPGSNPEPNIEPFDKSNTQVSQFLGNAATEQFTNVPVWNGIRYAELYPGADLELTSENGEFVWRLVIKDSTKFSQDHYIRSHGLSIKIAGQNLLSLTDGKVKFGTDAGDYILPDIQVKGSIDESAFIKTPNVVGDELFLVYPKNLVLNSDPSGLGKLTSFMVAPTNLSNLPQTDVSSNIMLATVFGGGAFDSGWATGVGPDGSIFVTGNTSSTDFPKTTGAYDTSLSGSSDAFIVKIDPNDGHRVYATYLGGSSSDGGETIAVNSNGEAYIAGFTRSLDFPLRGGPISSSPTGGFLAKLNANGNDLLYSSYIGNNCPVNSTCEVSSLAIDSNESVYMIRQVTPQSFQQASATALKLIVGHSVYEYSNSLGNGVWSNVDLRSDGSAYFVGSKYGTDNYPNVIVAALDNTGASQYSVSFGGITYDEGLGIAVDSDGNAYITGWTDSSNFPTKGRALTERLQPSVVDAFVTILDSEGTIQYSSYMDVGNCENGWAITIDDQGSIYVVGSGYMSETGSYYCSSQSSVFIVKLNVSQPKENYWLSYPQLLDGSGNEWVYGTTATMDDGGNIYVAGETNSSDFLGLAGSSGGDWQAFMAKVSAAQLYPKLPDLVTVSTGSEDGCFAAAYNGVSGIAGMPINTRTGGYDYTVKDLSISTSAGELVFQREYTSLSVNNPSTLSPGWTHNHDNRLILPTDPEGMADTILFKASTANKYTFAINSDGTYTAYPGLCATLVNQQGSYILKDGGQKTYTFNAAGKLVTYADAQDHIWRYIYETMSGQLECINADGNNQCIANSGDHYLSLHYDTQGRVDLVSDQAGRSVNYYYDHDANGNVCSTNGELCSSKDSLGQSWAYKYEELPHFLTRVVAPGNVTVEQTMYNYDNWPDVRAWKQFNGEGKLIVELTYNADGTTTVKDRVNDPNPETHVYDERGTLVTDQNGAGGEQGKHYDF